jgi:hypothetical protein
MIDHGLNQIQAMSRYLEVAFFLDVEQEPGVGAMAFDGVSDHT